MKTRSFLAPLFWVFVGAVLIFSSCAPVFSELQSARTVGKGNFELSPGFTTIAFTEDTQGKRETEHAQNHVGFQLAYGVGEKVDLRLRFERLMLADDGGNLNILGFGPKLGLIEDWLAFYVPLGFAFGDEVGDSGETWQIHPTLLATIPVIRTSKSTLRLNTLFLSRGIAKTWWQ